MGKVTDYLRDLIAKQVEEQGIVVWYDPEGYYAEMVDTLKIAETTVCRYQNSFFALRRKLRLLTA